MSIAIDSGAAESVIPHTLVTDYAISPTDKSRAGVCYTSATGEPIPSLGEQKLPLATVEGSLRAMTFQVAPVAKPLGLSGAFVLPATQWSSTAKGPTSSTSRPVSSIGCEMTMGTSCWTCGSRVQLRLTRTLWAKVKRLFRGSHSPCESAS